MRQSRLYTDQRLAPGETLTLDGPRAHYLARVLRLGAGDPVTFFNGDGMDYPAEIVAIPKGRAEARIGQPVSGLSESPLRITLVQAMSRGERMDMSLQKATELGAANFRLLYSDRDEVKLNPERLQKRMAHWRGVVISACEQTGRARLPEVREPVDLDSWLAASPGVPRFALFPGDSPSLASVSMDGRCELVVGPEGGFTNSEQERMRAAGVQQVGLGPRILRTETAGPAAIAVLQAAHGDLR